MIWISLMIHPARGAGTVYLPWPSQCPVRHNEGEISGKKCKKAVPEPGSVLTEGGILSAH